MKAELRTAHAADESACPRSFTSKTGSAARARRARSCSRTAPESLARRHRSGGPPRSVPARPPHTRHVPRWPSRPQRTDPPASRPLPPTTTDRLARYPGGCLLRALNRRDFLLPLVDTSTERREATVQNRPSARASPNRRSPDIRRQPIGWPVSLIHHSGRSTPRWARLHGKRKRQLAPSDACGRPSHSVAWHCRRRGPRTALHDDAFSPDPVDVEVTLDRLDRGTVWLTAAGQATPRRRCKILEPGVPPPI
jgi:hypothetical protein